MPSRTPKTAESTAEMPTSAIVGPALSLDLVPHRAGWSVYERPKLSVAVCFR